MVKEACVLVFGGTATLIGAAISTTDKGKIINESMKDAFELFDTRVSKYLPGAKEILTKLIGGK